ncbi:hypothetical protein ACIBF5_09890 [Micromonospora sp. NPDC050417]|uniref:hypothetical protein n=1 Tax=Micromonospora sp. NPDC050417 TaxID=3364280 RepID=UPI0037934601
MTNKPSSDLSPAAVEFRIRNTELAELNRVLANYGLHGNRTVLDAVAAFAVADARAALAVHEEVSRCRNTLERCPACKVPSAYVHHLGRHLHSDGSDSRACWRRTPRGKP